MNPNDLFLCSPNLKMDHKIRWKLHTRRTRNPLPHSQPTITLLLNLHLLIHTLSLLMVNIRKVRIRVVGRHILVNNGRHNKATHHHIQMNFHRSPNLLDLIHQNLSILLHLHEEKCRVHLLNQFHLHYLLLQIHNLVIGLLQHNQIIVLIILLQGLILILHLP